MADWLVARGHDVHVVTAPPYYPQWKVGEGFSGRWYRKHAVCGASRFTRLHEACKGGLVVYRCPLWVPANPSGLRRLLHLASFAASSFPVMLSQVFWRPDVVLVVEPALLCAPQAWLVARFSRAKVWLHIQDYEVDAAFDLGLLKGNVLRRFVTSCERLLMRRFDRVSTISKRMLSRALTKGIAPERALLFPNWINLDTFSPAQAQGCDYRAELDIPADAVVALYSGNMGNKQGLEILVGAAVLLCVVPKIVFVFCGNGAGRDELLMQCKGLSNVRFMNLQPLDRLGELLSMADIHLLPQRADAADIVMPSKLTGMLASGRPVVATAYEGTELASVVTGCGLVVPPERVQAFADAINMLANDQELRAKLGKAGRAYAEANLDRDMILGRFEAEMQKALAD